MTQWNKATIYRNLMDMEQAGLVKRMQLGDRVWRFHTSVAHADHGASHPHFVCIECGQGQCMPGATLKAPEYASLVNPGGIQQVEVIVRGYCEQCS